MVGERGGRHRLHVVHLAARDFNSRRGELESDEAQGCVTVILAVCNGHVRTWSEPGVSPTMRAWPVVVDEPLLCQVDCGRGEREHWPQESGWA